MRKVGAGPKDETRVVDEGEVIAVAAARPDQRWFVLGEEFGDRQAEVLTRQAPVEPDIARSDEVDDALPVRCHGQMHHPLVVSEAAGVQQQNPQILACLQRRFDGAWREGNVELVRRAVPTDDEGVGGNAERHAQVRLRSRRIDDVGNGGVAPARHRVRQRLRNVGVGIAVRIEEFEHFVDGGPARARNARIAPPGFQEIGDVDRFALDQALHLVLGLIAEGWEGFREAREMSRVGSDARIVQDDRLDPQQRAGVMGVVEQGYGDAALVDPPALEAYAHVVGPARRDGGRGRGIVDFVAVSQRCAAAAQLGLDRARRPGLDAQIRLRVGDAPAGEGRSVSMSSLLLFAAVYFAAVATPGPGVATLVARVLAHGLTGVAPFIAGYVVGDFIWLAIAGTGLAVVAHAFAGVFVALKFAGVAYLLYVAWAMARTSGAVAGADAPAKATRGWRAFAGSLSLTLGNPKVIVFFLSIMPLAVDLEAMTPRVFIAVATVMALVITATLTGYAVAANRARALLRSSRAAKIAHRAAAGVMAGVAIAIATR